MRTSGPAESRGWSATTTSFLKSELFRYSDACCTETASRSGFASTEVKPALL